MTLDEAKIIAETNPQMARFLKRFYDVAENIKYVRHIQFDKCYQVLHWMTGKVVVPYEALVANKEGSRWYYNTELLIPATEEEYNESPNS